MKAREFDRWLDAGEGVSKYLDMANAWADSFDFGDSTGRVPEAQDVDGLSLVVRLIDDAIGA